MAQESSSDGAVPSGDEAGLTPAEAIQLAQDIMAQGDFDSAGTIFSRVLAVVPEHPDALNFLAIVVYRSGDPKKALALSKRAAELAPEHAGILNNLGNMLLFNDDVPGAVEAYQAAVRLDPTPEAMSNLATIFKANGRYEEAEKLTRRALELDPEFGPANRTLGGILIATDRAQEAIDHLSKAQHLEIRDRYLLALAYDHLGSREKAVEVMKEWLKWEPDNPRARHLYAAFAGEQEPPRAADDFVEDVFDNFARSFDSKLAHLQYQAPQLVAAALERHFKPRSGELAMLDAGCGTGLCAPLVKEYCRHLTGVDLSGGMLTEAAKLGLYDRLVKGELTSFLAANPSAYDAIISADTLCYFGVLDEFATEALRALVPGGRLIFTVEALNESDSEDFRLTISGRYAHSAPYLARVLDKAGFEMIAMEQHTLRLELLAPVRGHIVSARRD